MNKTIILELECETGDKDHKHNPLYDRKIFENLKLFTNVKIKVVNDNVTIRGTCMVCTAQFTIPVNHSNEDDGNW